MNAEYQRLEAAARAVQRQIDDIIETRVVASATEHTQLERELTQLHIRLGSLRHGLVLVRSAAAPHVRESERRFVCALPRKFHSQGQRDQTIALRGEVTVKLRVTYYHRSRHVANVAKKSRRGMFPVLLLLGISEGLTPAVRSRMAKSAALLGSFDEAAEMLAEEGLCVSVNRLRKVTAGMGRMLARLTSAGQLTAAGDAAARRIVVTADGGRVRLRGN